MTHADRSAQLALASMPATVRVTALSVEALSVPLLEPFVIATSRIDTTRAALVGVTLTEVATGRTAHGLGEAAALPNVTIEDQPELIESIATLAATAEGTTLDSADALTAWLDSALGTSPVARAGLECAVLDAWARLLQRPLGVLLGGSMPFALVTDITLPIAEPDHMARLATGYRMRGFRAFKVKVGKDLAQDMAALAAVHAAVPDASFRLDANAGFSASQALALMERARQLALQVECFEQPCARDDLDGMAEVAARAGTPVIADESVRTLSDLHAIVARRAAQGVNLKLVKTGGLLGALELGRAARRAGLSIMCGGMVETRLGMAAMAHVACALGGVDFVDLDTAFLLASDPFVGGYEAEGPLLQLRNEPGLGIRRR